MSILKQRIIVAIIGIVLLLFAFLMKKLTEHLSNKYHTLSSPLINFTFYFSGMLFLFGCCSLLAAIITE